jgi:hypothetical protein
VGLVESALVRVERAEMDVRLKGLEPWRAHVAGQQVRHIATDFVEFAVLPSDILEEAAAVGAWEEDDSQDGAEAVLLPGEMA